MKKEKEENQQITGANSRANQRGKVRVGNFSISLDGYGAGPDQSLDHPLGIGGEAMHDWVIETRSWREMHRKEGGSEGVDNEFAKRNMDHIGAWIIGRNMFGPIRGPWPDETWKGWWGDNPPYHVPVYVLTHHPRPALEMEGGTTFHFVTGGIREALSQARKAAGEKDILIGGGADTIRQYLNEKLIDELHIAISPTILGSGEPLFHGLDLRRLGYSCVEFSASDKATHVVLVRKAEAK